MSAMHATERGFTLLELVVTIALLGVVAALVSVPLVNYIKAQREMSSISSERADLTFALNKIANDIRLKPANGNFTCSDSTVRLGDSPSIQYEYRSIDKTLILKELADDVSDSTVLADSVSQFTCRPISAKLDLYEIRIDVDSTAYITRAKRRVE